MALTGSMSGPTPDVNAAIAFYARDLGWTGYVATANVYATVLMR